MITFKKFLREEIKKAPLPKTKEDTEKALWEFEDCIEGGIPNCTIIETAFGPAVTVKGNVNLKALSLEFLPFRFHHVTGDFNCSMNKELLTLEGAPKWVGGNANFEHCWSLTNLDHLTVINFQSDGVASFAYCKALERVANEGKMMWSGGYIFSGCEKLSSLKGIGKIFGNLNIQGTGIHSLHDFHKDVEFSEHATSDLILFSGSKPQIIEECGLNLMLVKGLKDLTFSYVNEAHKWCEIVQIGFKEKQDILDVQDALIDAGFSKQARL